MTQDDAEYMESLLDGCLGTSESDKFTETFTRLLKQLRKKLYPMGSNRKSLNYYENPEHY